jgi:cobyrinic acid a,c-diamide synthase
VQPFERLQLEGFFYLKFHDHPREETIKGLVIAGTKSGSGKTTVTLALLAALVRRGLSVAPFKVGPDFIDPGHHSQITGSTSRNLDGWMLSENRNRACFTQHACKADVAVVEGVMGLFDGYDGKSEAGSTAQMAKWLGLPVLLIVDAKSMARSAAALVQGFEGFDSALTFVGTVFNNVGSSRHLSYLREAVQESVKTPCLGGIRRNVEIEIPERHLGLVTSQDHLMEAGTMGLLADSIEENIDIDDLLNRLPDITLEALPRDDIESVHPQQLRLGVPKDNAFCFYYQDNLDLLKANGAELVFFSPLSDDSLPDNLDGLYIGGGYPELFAEKLSGQKRLRRRIRQMCMENMPIYAECGGFMYLCDTLIDMDGHRYPMVGCFPFTAQMFSRRKALGYREVSLAKDTIIGKTDQVIRGHEFHYSELTDASRDIEKIYRVSDRNHMENIQKGYQIRQCLGSYIHLHFGSCPDAARHFMESCRQYKTGKDTDP